ncbi:MAG TPA: formate dehydrogenase subunit delta [Acidisoma sp.]|jgi:formate dehydrogenase subunit delta|nr:formate dehydrogenase subunit delta [Acidisoma sp.]
MNAVPPSADLHGASAGEAKLVYMANQIAKFFASQPHDSAVSDIETHIRKFWDPRMRAKILAVIAADGEGLDPLAREAIARLAT